jgi:N4-(beta-N-acetylglucosaminyl)-L-asparaginase
MRLGMSPQDAAVDALSRIAKYYPNFKGAVAVSNITGHHAGAAWGWNFTYSYRQGSMTESKVVNVAPFTMEDVKSLPRRHVRSS